ncbi:MAG: hypothetical protein ACRDQ4_23230 [Pseudonocardiaceae bacterium]
MSSPPSPPAGVPAGELHGEHVELEDVWSLPDEHTPDRTPDRTVGGRPEQGPSLGEHQAPPDSAEWGRRLPDKKVNNRSRMNAADCSGGH